MRASRESLSNRSAKRPGCWGGLRSQRTREGLPRLYLVLGGHDSGRVQRMHVFSAHLRTSPTELNHTDSWRVLVLIHLNCFLSSHSSYLDLNSLHRESCYKVLWKLEQRHAFTSLVHFTTFLHYFETSVLNVLSSATALQLRDKVLGLAPWWRAGSLGSDQFCHISSRSWLFQLVMTQIGLWGHFEVFPCQYVMQPWAVFI